VIYKTIGSVDLLEMRRKILAAMPSDYVGFNKYWESRQLVRKTSANFEYSLSSFVSCMLLRRSP